MNTTTLGRPAYERPELGQVLQSFGSGFNDTWLLVSLGAFLLVFPIVMALVYKAQGNPDWASWLFVELVDVPLGLYTGSRGLRQRAASLILREQGFEYTSGSGAPRSVRYADVEKLVLREWREMPTGIAVHLRGGGTIVMKCLEARGYRDGYNEIERRMSAGHS